MQEKERYGPFGTCGLLILSSQELIENPENFILARYQYHVSAGFYNIQMINEGP